MSALSRLEGVFVANVTPFDASGAVSLARYQSHLEFLASRGVHGFVPCGTTGEGSTLSDNERCEILAATVAFSKPRGLKVIAGCGGNNTGAVAKLVTEAKELGCDAALVVTPYYNKPTPSGLLAHYRFVADRGGLPIVLYNVPSRTAVHLSADLVKQLFEHPLIVGLKEASGQFGHWLALATSCDTTKKALLSGDDDALAVLQAFGGSGIISASANVIPDVFVSIYRLGKEGKWAEAFALQKKVFPLVKTLFMETNPAPVKCALEAIGLGEAHLRLPLVPVQPETGKAVRAALKDLDILK